MAWLKYTGLRCGLTLAQTYASRPSEILDLNSCDAIQHGAKQKKEIETFDDFLNLR